ncbi:hypothetical protein M1P56_35835 (plasmid) [Streptomyces sp. HU2014]|uniref:hypothetical protein n=1 Tax=Streptomyces sp. HU2014 TaxID=2939414 RepID=UPI00200EB253|nr:hypothetical protein [Streptomyces sp. HU2014]UQI49775.1 hypothetical protein M1P56_35835 [Streptomyces sp. HU2014]
MTMTTDVVKADATAGERGLTRKTARRLALAERLVYGAAGSWAAVGPQMDIPWWAHGAALATGALTCVGLWKRSDTDDWTRRLTASLRALPVLGWSSAYTGGLLVPVFDYPNGWPMLGAAAWTVVMIPMAPWTRSKGVARAVDNLPVLVAEPEVVEGEPVTFADHMQALWNHSQATGDTTLEGIRQYSYDEPDFEAIVLAPAGHAVPRTLDERAIAGVFDVPVDAVATKAVDGYGPGRLAIQVAPRLAEARRVAEALEAEAEEPGTALERIWAEHVNCVGGAAPGVDLVAYSIGEEQIRLRIAAQRGKTLRVHHEALCSALGIDDISRLVMEGAGPREAVVYIYRANPLLHVRAPTVEDLTMDDRGRISIGVAHDGTVARIQLFNFDTGRAQHGITAGTTGAGKSGLMRILGAAQRISGVISWMADVQGGMSMPEMEGRIDWMAKGPAETMQQLRALHAVKEYREAHSRGRGDFDFHGEWCLIQWTGDEINRLLSSLDQDIRKEAAWMIGDLQKTGQKVGIGVDLAVQSLHLKELGDSHEIREKGKEGHVFLLRTASSSTQGMGLDGIAPIGAHVSPIPERIYEGAGAKELFEGTAATEGVPTPGMGWLITEGKAILFRTFVLEKVNGLYPQLEELMDGRPMPTLTPGEARAAGAAYARRGTAKAAGGASGPSGGRVDMNALNGELERIVGLLEADNEAKRQDGDLPEAPSPMAAAKAKAPTIRERILAALQGHPDGLALKEIRTAVGCGTEGGPATRSVNNEVSALANENLLVPLGKGVYRLP